MSRPHNVLMLVHDRPIYNYMALDGLARATRSAHRLTVFHHPSGNPQVPQVLAAFQARGTIAEIIEVPGPQADIARLMGMAAARGLLDDAFFFYVEDDVVIEPDSRCWIEKMLAAFAADDRLAMVGSAIDPADFIDPEALAARLSRPLTREERRMIKADSPERDQRFENGLLPGERQNVAGRLLGLRRAAITPEVVNIDARVNAALRAGGWRTATLEGVRHRHLSLQLIHDYPDYQARRDAYVRHNER